LGDVRTVRTACPLDCWDNCGLLVEVEDGRVRGVRGDPQHPVTRGRVCAKARFQLDRHRSPDRLTRPLVRVRRTQGRRDAPGSTLDLASGELHPATWDDALDLVAGRLLEARERYGSPAVLHYWDSGSMGLLKGLYRRLFNLFGGVTEPRGSLCWGAGLAAQEADFGRVLAHDPRDLARSGAVFVWGRNPADTNTHLMPFLREARRRGAPVVVIDPRRTATVDELGAFHVAVRPGTDALLALGLAGELIRRGDYDRAFCRDRALGFEAYAATARRVGLTTVSERCGVPLEDVERLVSLLSPSGTGRRERPVAFLLGYGLQRHRRGGEAVRAIDALAAVAGSIGRPGGGANYANRHAEGLLRDLASDGPAASRRLVDRPALGRVLERLGALAGPVRGGEPGTDGPDGEVPTDGPDGEVPVEVFFCECANPVAQLPDSRRVVSGLSRVPFKVVVELRPTDTTALADVVLPAADVFEDEDLFFCSWHSFFTWGVPAVAPQGEARPDTEIVAALAERLGLGERFRRSPAEWVAYALEPLVRAYPDLAPGGDVMRLRGTTFPNPAAREVPWAEGEFGTPSGRFEFGTDWPSATEALEGGPVGRPVPEAEEHPDAGAGPEGSPRQDGLLFHLITPQHRLTLHSQFYDKVLERTGGRDGMPALHLHPSAAAALGLEEGARVSVETDQGRLEARLVLDRGLRPDTACLYSGGWVGLGARGRPTSANLLTPDRLTDMGCQAAYYDCLCRVLPAGRAGVGGPPES